MLNDHGISYKICVLSLDLAIPMILFYFYFLFLFEKAVYGVFVYNRVTKDPLLYKLKLGIYCYFFRFELINNSLHFVFLLR